MTVQRDSNKIANSGVAVVGIGLGLAFLGIGIWRHQAVSGLIGVVIMVGYLALLWALRRRSESALLLSSNPTDERQEQVMLRAAASTGYVVVVALVIGMLVSAAAQSGYTGVFTWLTALGGATFIGSTIWYSRRT